MGPRPEARLIVKDAAEAAVQWDWYISAVSTAIIQAAHQATVHFDCPRQFSRPAVPVRGNLRIESKA